MKKIKVTNKSIRDGSLLGFGYCNGQSLFVNTSPEAYTAGVYGWNADIYTVDGLRFITGYRFTADLYVNDIIKPYEEAAKEIVRRRLPYDEERKQIDALLQQFVEECKHALVHKWEKEHNIQLNYKLI